VEEIGSVVERLHAGIWTLDRDGVTTYANQRMHDLLGVAVGSMVGRPLLEFVDPSDHAKVLQGLRRRGEGRSDAYDIRLRNSDGAPVHVRVQASPVVEDGRVIGSVAAVTDVTDLAVSAADITAALDHAEQSATSASRLLSWVSHELRTPLNTINGFAQLLEQTLTDPTQQTLVGHIQSATAHVASLARDLLDFAKAGSGTLHQEPETLEMAEVVAEAITLVDSAARESNVVVVTEAAPVRAVGDRRRVVQVLVNLLSNAIRHGGPDRQVTIATTSTDGWAACSVTDEGPGVSPADRERVFLPFERAANGAPGGTGLGLAIADGLARAMGGRLTLEAAQQAGATFTLVLPAAGATDDGHPSGVAADTAGAATSGPAGRILYVEDEPLNAALVENIVALLPGRTLEVAPTVAAGVAAIDAQPPALVILDLNLPDGTGFDVLRHIRANPALADLAVFILSADATLESERLAVDLGANRYIHKPFDLRQFLDLLEMATRS
jgi:PAS domain S-box-containing protein